MKQLYASVPGISNIISINTGDSHSSQVSQATIICNSTTLDIGDSITVDIGYVGDYSRVFTGYVKTIEKNVPDNTLTVVGNGVLIRASDYFIVADTPDTPYTWSNVEVGDLVYDILVMAGLSNFGTFQDTLFSLGINTNVEVNLVTALDFCKMVSDIVTWHLWADVNGQIQFQNRKPFLMTGSEPQPGWANDTSVGTEITDSDIIAYSFSRIEKDLRNKVVVYGTTGISAQASNSESYDPSSTEPDKMEQILPSGFYKAAVAATALLTTTTMAQDTADYNLHLYNRVRENINVTIQGDSTRQCRTAISLSEDVTGLATSDWYVYGIEHTWSADGFTTSLDLRR